jgi:hypothetical protein
MRILVRNEKARGSNPLTSTALIVNDLQKRTGQVTTLGYHKSENISGDLRLLDQGWCLPNFRYQTSPYEAS